MRDEPDPLSRARTEPAAEHVKVPVASESRPADAALLAGRYRVIEMLGRGGMGEVVKAEDISLGQTVALKFLPATVSSDPRAMERVRDEVRVARRVSHPNVCRVHDLGDAAPGLFISMEYVDGEDLASLLRRVGRLAGERALAISRELCAGLAAAHAAGVIHRDLKPANVMLDRAGRVKITDFGLARIGEESGMTAEISGTPAYMAPEQLAGLGATVRSDLYALGLVLYELFTGRKVFTAGGNLTELIRHRRATAIVPPRDVVGELDEAVDRVIVVCLANRPEDRPATALDVLTALSGGNAMLAALAAGQTPSPSAVAATPVRGSMSPLSAWSCLAAVALSLALYLGPGGRIALVDRVRPLPPAALAVKAEEAMRSLGATGPFVDEASGFSYEPDALRAAVKNARDPKGDRRLAGAERRMIVFWHRLSPAPLVALGRTGQVSRGDPPLGPGEALAVVDGAGRILAYESVSSHEPGAGAQPVTPLATFLSLAALKPTGDAVPAPHDGRVAVDVTLDDAVQATVEAEVRGGVLTEARLVAPWTKPAKLRSAKAFELSDVSTLFTLALLFASVPLARRNLKAGRGDRDGARRIGLLVFGCTFAATVLKAHHTGTVGGESHVVLAALASAIYFGVTAVLLYLALEPLVRRAWPERLVSWTRLLAGDFRDAMVARDVLVGTAAMFAQGGLWIALAAFQTPPPLFPIEKDLSPLLGLGNLVAALGSTVGGSVRIGLMFLLLLLLLRGLGRARWAAPLAFVLAMVAYTMSSFTPGARSAILLAQALGLGLAILFLIVRFGLLAMIATIFFGGLSTRIPETTRLSGWMSPSPWFVVVLGMGISAWCLYFATGAKPFGDREPLVAA